MQILLTAATNAEIEGIDPIPGQVDLLITGVGIPATLYHIQQRLSKIKYDLVVQAGIAGTFNDGYALGTVVMVGKDIFGDIGMEAGKTFTSIYQTAFVNKNEFPFTDGWLVNEQVFLQSQRLPLVNAVTINKISDHELQKEQLINCFSPDIESMEGAALHYICLQENIPFLQIRAVSNLVGIRDKSKWKMTEALRNLRQEIQLLIQQKTLY